LATIIKGKNARKPWTVRYFHDGRQREISFRTKREADDYKAKFEHDSRARIFTDPAQANIRFEDAAAAWLSRHPGSPRTKEIYETALRLHVNPVIGKLGLAKVADSREMIETLLRSTLPEKGFSPSVVRTCYMVIGAVVSDALRSGRISQSRIRGIRLPPVAVRADITFASHEQVKAIAADMPDCYGWTIYLMRGCGLRLGEALGVRDGDVTDGSLRCARQLVPDGKQFTGLKHRREGDYRDIPVPRYVIDAKPATAPYDAPVSHRKYRDWFNAARDKAGLPPEFTPHTLRHIFASSCLAGGIPITDVSKWLGHQNIQVTFGIYGHLAPASWERARSVLDAEWGGAAGT
jgi:integrase